MSRSVRLAAFSLAALLFPACTRDFWTLKSADYKSEEKKVSPPTEPKRDLAPSPEPTKELTSKLPPPSKETAMEVKDNLPVIPAPNPAAAEVPEGYRVETAVVGLMYPSCVEFDGAGHMYVGECGHMPGDNSQPARILRISIENPQRREVLSDKLIPPITDLLWHEGKLYVSHKSKISVLENGELKDLVTDLPSLGDHSNNQLTVGPDKKIYVGQGSATNSGVVGEDNFAFGWLKEHPEVCEVPAWDITLRGQVFETGDPRSNDPSAKAQTSAYQPFGKTVPEGTVVRGQVKSNGSVLRFDPDGSNLEVFAWGFRNPYGVMWSPDGVLYVADAGSDERGSRNVADEPEKLFLVKEGSWHGWPEYFAGKPANEPQFRSSKGKAPEFLWTEHPSLEQPLMTFELHSSVTQIAFSRNDRFGAEGALFLASSGDQSPVTAAKVVRAGYWVKKIDPATKKEEMFFRTRPDALGSKDLEYVTTAGPKRLVGLRFSPDGSALYVVDIGPVHYVQGPKGPQAKAFPNTGVIWKISRNP